jgi:phage FluMu protein Com
MKVNKAETAARSLSDIPANEKRLLYGGEQRCICNRLICIIKGDVVEIKCPKCKRILEIFTKGIIHIECK